MSDDRHVTKGEMNLHLENLSLKVTQKVSDLFDAKFGEMTERIDIANIERRDSTIQAVTGFSWDDRDKVKNVIQNSHEKLTSGADTKKTVKKAVINYGVPISLAGVVSWVVSSWDK